MQKIKFKSIVAALVCALSLFMLSGCGLFDDSHSISGIRERVQVLRRETSDKIIDAFKKNDAQAVISLFCPQTQALPDIEEQVQKTFTFMEGEISKCEISDIIGYEDYANEGTYVTDYAFGSSTYITTDTGRFYQLYLGFNYIAADSSIEGLTWYNLSEYDKEVDRKNCRAGYNWITPYDPEIGILSADIVKAIGSGDAAEFKKLLCPQTQRIADIDEQISAVLSFFDGKPTFIERADGLYNYFDVEENFSYRALAFNEDENSAWTHCIAQPVCTDTGKRYEIDFVAFVKNSDTDKQGVSCITLEDWDTKEEVRLGEWIDNLK